MPVIIVAIPSPEAGSIKAGYVDVGMAGGVESMTMWSMQDSVDPSKMSEKM